MTGQPGTSRQETFRIDGSDLMDKAKQLVDEGNRHRLVVRNEHGNDVFDIPLTLAVVGGIIVFPATAVAAIAALATRHSILVESVAPAGEPGTPDGTPDAAPPSAPPTMDPTPFGSSDATTTESAAPPTDLIH
jgi:hypothetical protein